MKDYEALIKETKFLIEATNDEHFYLWKEFANRREHPTNIEWKEEHNGYLITIGYLDSRPINIFCRWVRLNNILVCFYEAVSQVVDWAQIEQWWDDSFKVTYDNGRRARCNTANFHHCLEVIQEFRLLD